MIELSVPGKGDFAIEHLVLDVNGTLARDGELLAQVVEPLLALREQVTLHMVTANTFGRQDAIDARFGIRSTRLSGGNEAQQKADYVTALGAQRVVAMGNGNNDAGMLKAAAIGIAVLGPEGLATGALLAADIVVGDPVVGLALLLHPQRLRASLRG